MATKTTVTSGAWSAGATWGGSAPADGDAVVIDEGHSILADVDMSGWTGLAGITIKSSNSTPGMLYCYNGYSAYIKILTDYDIQGDTTGSNRGRILVNSDGVWGNTGTYAQANKFIIDLQGTASIIMRYLDWFTYQDEPTTKYVRTYGTKYDFTASSSTVDVANDTIDLGVTPPSAGTAVKIIALSGGTLPGGLNEDDFYYIRGISGTKCKLALQNNDTTIVDITSTGSGSCTIYTGHTNTSTNVMNVLDDVTGESSFWTTTSDHNRVALIATSTLDYQRLTLIDISSTQITLSSNVDSAQPPGARIYLLSRNISIRTYTSTAAQACLNFASATSTLNNLGFELSNTGSIYGYGLLSCNNHIINGTISGYRYTISGNNNTISGLLCAGEYGLYNSWSNTITGALAGFANGIYGGSLNKIYGEIVGSTYSIYMGSYATITGKIFGSAYGVSQTPFTIVSGTIYGCGNALINSFGSIVSGTLSGCYTGINSVYGCIITGTIIGCITGLSSVSAISCGMRTNTNVTDVGNYLSGSTLITIRSFNHNRIANNTQAWSSGGRMITDATVYPSGKSSSMKFIYESANSWNQMYWEIPSTDPASLSFTVYAKHDSTGLSSNERIHWQIVRPDQDPFVDPTDSPVAEWIADDSTDWQTSTLSYTRTEAIPLILRCIAKRASGYAWAYVDQLTSGGGTTGGGNIFQSVVR